MNDTDVLVIGGGASGMMAAITAAERGRHTVIIEKNEKLGKKLFITGKGRCNLTNACDTRDIFGHIVSNEKFMYSAINRFNNLDVMDFFEDAGVRLKTERGERVFPVSDHSSDVIKALERKLRTLSVEVRLNTVARKLIIKNDRCVGAVIKPDEGGREEIHADSVIVATGGLSYPATGSTGDGYKFAKELGLGVKEAHPSLVPFNISGEICGRLQGLTLKNVKISVTHDDKSIYQSGDVGEMLFTHFGVSGPLILTASSELSPDAYKKGLTLHIDLKPALGIEELDKRIIRDFDGVSNKEYKNSLNKLLPSKLVPVMVELSGIAPYKKVNTITKDERLGLARCLKDMQLEIIGTRGFEEAIITKGGISVKDIDPKTFEVKGLQGLYFVGEVLDVDAHTGGFNLQIAWSSGHAAGSNA